jgi:hypothetical protein
MLSIISMASTWLHGNSEMVNAVVRDSEIGRHDPGFDHSPKKKKRERKRQNDDEVGEKCITRL